MVILVSNRLTNPFMFAITLARYKYSILGLKFYEDVAIHTTCIIVNTCTVCRLENANMSMIYVTLYILQVV